MSDEQIIYLSPEEELTNVRERLARTQARRLILVIPPQTQLRSHVGWRLLHTSTRELGKDVLVISTDRQVRSVAKAAGFRVADSQESPPSGGTRPGSRPSRSNPSLSRGSMGGKTPGRVRGVPGRGMIDRGSSTDIRLRSRADQGVIHRTPTGPAQTEPESAPGPVEPQSAPNGTTSEGPAIHGASVPGGDSTTLNQGATGTQGKPYDQGYDFQIETTPPSQAEQEYEDQDQLAQDYNVAQAIRKAARRQGQEVDTNAPTLPDDSRIPPQPPPRIGGELIRDPFSFMEDQQPAPLPEQHGAAHIDELDEGVPDIADYPTDIIDAGEIEDLGDEGDIVIPGSPPVHPSHPWNQPIMEEPEVAESPEPPRVPGVRPRNNRPGIVPLEDESEEALPPIEDQTTKDMPSPPARRPTTPAPAPTINRGLTGSAPRATTRNAGAGTAPTRVPAGPAPQRVGASLAGARSARGASQQRTATPPGRRAVRRRTGSRVWIAVSIVLILLIIVGLALAYFGPTADITLPIPTQSYSTPLDLTATASSPFDAVHHTLPAKMLTFDTSVMGTGSATGSKKVGTAPATGNVDFTNNGKQSVDIPTGTIVSTSKGVQFATTGDVLVPPVGSPIGNTVPVTIQAQSAGTSGNVPANSITVIPSSSLAQIEQANNLSSVSLSVTNPAAITNGGVGNAAAVTANDIATLRTSLNQQLQQRANDWLAKNVRPDDVRGKLVQQETLATMPMAGEVAPSGTFTGQLSLHLTLLVVRAADLQTAAQAEFNAAAGKFRAGYGLAPQQNVSLVKTTSHCTPTSGETAIILCYTATGQIAPQITVQQVRDLVAGKTIPEAQVDLARIVPGAGTPMLSVNPAFMPWLPWWSQHINVHFKLVPATTTPVPKKK